MKWLFDTNVVSETIRRRPAVKVMNWLAAQSPGEAAISVVAMAELAEGISLISDVSHRDEMQHWMKATVLPWLGENVLPLTEEVLVDWLKLSRNFAAKRKTRKAPDALIASTARVHNLIVVTRNVRDFADTGIVVYDPWNNQTHRMDAP